MEYIDTVVLLFSAVFFMVAATANAEIDEPFDGKGKEWADLIMGAVAIFMALTAGVTL
jgi:hypothetical protein